MSLLGLAAVAGVAVFLQGVGAGEDPEVILTAVGCSPIPFCSLVPQARTFTTAADSHTDCIWGQS